MADEKRRFRITVEDGGAVLHLDHTELESYVVQSHDSGRFMLELYLDEMMGCEECCSVVHVDEGS